MAQADLDERLRGRRVLLNGRPLAMSGDALPALEPKVVAAGSKEEFTLELRTYAFVVLPKAKHPACADVRRQFALVYPMIVLAMSCLLLERWA